jgi:riboflavin synthase
MFTGLIETTGTVVSITPTDGATRLILAAPALAGRWRTGDSIAVNGVCLTAIPLEEPTHFAADLAGETLARTTLGSLAAGATSTSSCPPPQARRSAVTSCRATSTPPESSSPSLPLHPDLDTTDWRLTLELPDQLTSQVISQGSITVDGISLTVARLDLPRIEIAIIPHTYKSTNLHTLTPGSAVNLETDVLAKYAAAQRAHSEENWLTPAYLLANGY